jgi:hypothetical protein
MTGRLYPIPSAPARTKTAPSAESADFPSCNELLEKFWHGVADVTAAAEDFLHSYSRMFLARPRPLGAFTSLDLPEKANTFSGPLGELINTVVFAFGSVGAPAERFLIVKPISTIRDASPSVVKTSGRLFP